MDLENCSVSSSLSPSPSSAAEVSDDRLVEMELEAAEALADLAHLAMRESGGGGTVTNWGLKGKRVKSDSLSPPGPSGMNLTPIDPVQHCSDPAEVSFLEYYLLILFLFVLFIYKHNYIFRFHHHFYYNCFLFCHFSSLFTVYAELVRRIVEFGEVLILLVSYI